MFTCSTEYFNQLIESSALYIWIFLCFIGSFATFERSELNKRFDCSCDSVRFHPWFHLWYVHMITLHRSIWLFCIVTKKRCYNRHYSFKNHELINSERSAVQFSSSADVLVTVVDQEWGRNDKVWGLSWGFSWCSSEYFNQLIVSSPLYIWISLCFIDSFATLERSKLNKRFDCLNDFVQFHPWFHLWYVHMISTSFHMMHR